MTSNHCLRLLITAQPGESQAYADGESASGESQGSASESANPKKKDYMASKVDAKIP